MNAAKDSNLKQSLWKFCIIFLIIEGSSAAQGEVFTPQNVPVGAFISPDPLPLYPAPAPAYAPGFGKEIRPPIMSDNVGEYYILPTPPTVPRPTLESLVPDYNPPTPSTVSSTIVLPDYCTLEKRRAKSIFIQNHFYINVERSPTFITRGTVVKDLATEKICRQMANR